MMDRALQAAEAAKAGGAPPVSFISHERERKEIGKPCWSHIASEIPRVQHDGSLAMPGTGRRDDLDLSTLRRRFPSLPFVKFEGAARATVLYEEAPEVTEGVMAQVRACFAAEAAGLTIALCMPELWARKELMQEERYCVNLFLQPAWALAAAGRLIEAEGGGRRTCKPEHNLQQEGEGARGSREP